MIASFREEVNANLRFFCSCLHFFHVPDFFPFLIGLVMLLTSYYYAEDDDACDAVVYGDQPSVYAKPDVILKWITEGRPKDTDWLDGVTERKYRW